MNNINSISKYSTYIKLFILLLTVLIVFPGCAAIPYTPEITGANEEPLPGSIASLEKVKIGGIEQSVLIRGKNIHNPVLLFLHGGPGAPEEPLVRHYNAKLEDYFVVVHWAQRGSAKSYSEKIPVETMNVGQFVSDTHEIVEYLRNRFSQDKIFMVGHSWGSVLGMLVIHKYPEFFHAYVSVGQGVSITENDQVSYHHLLDLAARANNRKALRELEAINKPDPYGTIDPNGRWFKRLVVHRKWLLQFGGMIYKERSLAKWIAIYAEAPEYSMRDSVNWLSGHIFSVKAMWPQIYSANLTKEVPKVDVPVYFCIGRHDYNTPFELAEKYFNGLEAPKKELIWFENSAHSPLYEEADKFNDLLINHVRQEMNSDNKN